MSCKSRDDQRLTLVWCRPVAREIEAARAAGSLGGLAGGGPERAGAFRVCSGEDPIGFTGRHHRLTWNKTGTI